MVRRIVQVFALAAMAAGCSSNEAVPEPKSAPRPAAAPGPAMSAAPAPIPASVEVRASGKTLEFVFHVSRVSALVYQLDCIAAGARGSREAYEALWKNELGGWSKDDDAALAEWGKIKSRYQGTITPRDEDANAEELPTPHAGHGVESSVRMAGYAADSIDRLEESFGFLMSVPDAARARAIVERFLPRMDAHWQKVEPDMKRAADSFAEALRGDVGSFVERVAKFYGAELPPHAEMRFELFPRPPHESPTHGEQIGARSLVEVVPGEKVAERLDVVLHELFHFFHAAAPPERQRELAARVLEADDPRAYADYVLMDEALATALGNGLVLRMIDADLFEKRAAKPKGLYFDEFVDPAAKSVLPWLDGAVKDGPDIFDPSFSSKYVASLKSAFPSGLPPRAYLKASVMVYEEELGPAFDDLDGAVHASSLAASSALDAEAASMLKERSRWAHVVLVSTAHVKQLASLGLDKEELSAIEKRAKRAGAFAHASLRRGKGPRFVLVAKDLAEMKALVGRFAKLEALAPGVVAE